MRLVPFCVVSVPTLKVMSPAGDAPWASAVMCVPLLKVTVSAVMVIVAGVLVALPPLPFVLIVP